MVVLILIAVYLLLGLMFSVAFLAKGIYKVDEAAKQTGIGFKLILLPGITVLWPILLNKWRKAK